MALKFKQGVRVGRGPGPQLLLALTVANEVYAEHGADCIVTSLDDGEHHSRSRHYLGDAVDLRVKHLSSANADEIFDELYHRLLPLGPEFLVLREFRGEPQDHIHIQYQGMRSNR
jgi:hypothetical protein